MNLYLTLKAKHQKEVADFPMFFAFSDEQFTEGMKKLGLAPDSFSEICRLNGTGGYYRRTDSDKLHEMFDRHERERNDAIENNTTGDRYIFDMFYCELSNHEYCLTYDITETLDVLGMTIDEVNSNKKLLRGLNKAIEAQKSCFG